MEFDWITPLLIVSAAFLSFKIDWELKELGRGLGILGRGLGILAIVGIVAPILIATITGDTQATLDARASVLRNLPKEVASTLLAEGIGAFAGCALRFCRQIQ